MLHYELTKQICKCGDGNIDPVMGHKLNKDNHLIFPVILVTDYSTTGPAKLYY